MHAILSVLILSIAIFAVAQLLPGIHVRNFGTAVIVALVYSVINFFLGTLLTLLALPLVVLTLGLFKLVINAVLLWVTDQFVDDFRIDGFGTTLLAAVLIAIIDGVLRSVLL